MVTSGAEAGARGWVPFTERRGVLLPYHAVPRRTTLPTRHDGPMRTERPLVVTAALALTLTLTAGCASEEKTPQMPKTASGSLEEIASQAKCEPQMQTDEEELRQALCKTKDGRYVLVTFATDRGQREWINGAKDYGGTYLVGRKWVAVGDDATVATLRGRIGGDVENGTSHTAAPGGGDGSDKDGGKGHSGHTAS